MEVKFEDFNGIFENAFSSEFCDGVIEQFERAVSMGFGMDRQQFEGAASVVKDDHAITVPMLLDTKFPAYLLDSFNEEFTRTFWGEIYPHYSKKYSALETMPRHTIYSHKVQRTKVGGGYHVWHSEHSRGIDRDRIMTYILYLNDVEEGGETEFLYTHKRYKPKQGTLILSPAGYTHTHRGNPPLSNTKYIVTGWVEFE